MPHLTTDDGVKKRSARAPRSCSFTSSPAAAVPGSMSNKIIHKGLAHLTANRAVLQRHFLS